MMPVQWTKEHSVSRTTPCLPAQERGIVPGGHPGSRPAVTILKLDTIEVSASIFHLLFLSSLVVVFLEDRRTHIHPSADRVNGYIVQSCPCYRTLPHGVRANGTRALTGVLDVLSVLTTVYIFVVGTATARNTRTRHPVDSASNSLP